MKKIALLLILASSLSAKVISTPSDGCTKIQVDNDSKVEHRAIKVLSKKVSYGMYLNNMDINFDQRTADFDLRQAVTLGFDRNITNQKISISEDHPRFNEFTNLLQKDLFFISEICLTKDNMVKTFKLKAD
ncbi:MAG: hypothetical protein BM556_10960 [Bacteriovorax sp. MedPE-SWde]|nr:MAG: hypothetical protein BM556_10960 [Bacteriovorax sp. MedPE-SWde]